MQSGEFIRLAQLAILGVTIAIYWFHCIRPALKFHGAYPRTLRIVAALGLIAWIASAVSLVFWLQYRPVPLAVTGVLFATSAFYLLAWPRPGFIAQLCGGRDPLAELRLIAWGLGARLYRVVHDAGDPKWRTQALQSQERLRRFRGSADTERYVALWMTEATVILDGAETDVAREQRHEEIRGEARRLWPSDDDWRMAALV